MGRLALPVTQGHARDSSAAQGAAQPPDVFTMREALGGRSKTSPRAGRIVSVPYRGNLKASAPEAQPVLGVLLAEDAEHAWVLLRPGVVRRTQVAALTWTAQAPDAALGSRAEAPSMTCAVKEPSSGAGAEPSSGAGAEPAGATEPSGAAPAAPNAAAELAALAEDVQRFAALAEGDAVVVKGAAAVKGTLVEKCRFGGLVLGPHEQLWAAGFARLFPAAATPE